MELAALVVFIIFSIFAFILIALTNNGTSLIFVGALIYAFMTSFELINVPLLIILFILFVLGEIIEFISVILLGKKFGASKRAIVAMLIGGILGAMIGTPFLGVGAFAGSFLGIFLGAFACEMIYKKDFSKSLRASMGGVLGRFISMGLKFLIAIAMVTIVILRFSGTF